MPPARNLLLLTYDADRAAARTAALRAAGWAVAGGPIRDRDELLAPVATPPDAIVVDLDRAPAQGRDVALYLRRRKALRRVPLVFAGGEAPVVAGVRAVLPDAVFTSWRAIRKG